jgi:hypothetical protein
LANGYIDLNWENAKGYDGELDICSKYRRELAYKADLGKRRLVSLFPLVSFLAFA